MTKKRATQRYQA